MTTSTTKAVLDTTLSTALAVAQAMAITNPKVAAALALAPLIEKLIDDVVTIQQAGTLSPEKLAEAFLKVGNDIRSTHDEWAAMNKAGA